MNVTNAPESRRDHIWLFDIEDPVYDIACAAMESRPDFHQIEKLWSTINDRFLFMRYDYDPDKHDNLLYQMDMTELAGEAEITDNQALSHLRTMHGAGLIRSLVVYQEYNSVSVVVSPHMVKK